MLAFLLPLCQRQRTEIPWLPKRHRTFGPKCHRILLRLILGLRRLQGLYDNDHGMKWGEKGGDEGRAEELPENRIKEGDNVRGIACNAEEEAAKSVCTDPLEEERAVSLREMDEEDSMLAKDKNKSKGKARNRKTAKGQRNSTGKQPFVRDSTLDDSLEASQDTIKETIKETGANREQLQRKTLSCIDPALMEFIFEGLRRSNFE